MSSIARALRASIFQADYGARLATAFAAYVALGGLVSFAGWVLDAPSLADWDGDGIVIQPNATLAAILAATALFCLVLRRFAGAAILGSIVALIGAATAFENAAGVALGLDTLLLFDRAWGTEGTTAPGRMGLPASFSWAVLGSGIVAASFNRSTPRRWAAHAALVPAAIALLSLIGYLYDASELYSIPGRTAIALQTATFVLAAAAALILAIPESAPMRVFGDPSAAGIATRRLLPFVIVVPIVTGELRLLGEQLGWYDTAFGVALHTLAEIALLLIVLWWTGLAIARQARERQLAEAARERLLTLEQEARHEAERQATIRDEFLATLSHELRTPLNAVLGWSHILRTDLGNPERALHAIEVIERNARLQTQLISDLLDMSRIVSGKMRLHVQPVELPAVIAAAVEAVQPAADARGVRLQQSIEPPGQVVHGDPARLQQVVWNLLSNAVKFTPRGGRVHVVLARVGSHVQLRVSDTGEGIAAEFLPMLFERFRQADSGAARAHGGLGLGLALVKQLVELYGGTVKAESDGAGRGATFTVDLPLAIAYPSVEEPRVHPVAPQPHRVAGELPSLNGLHVLVVDDEPDALRMVERVLGDRGARVTSATGTGAALELAGRRHFDVVVSDIGMPHRDGYELIKELRSRGVTTPAIALTAFARAEDRTRALSSGYQSHIAKPVEPAELLAAVTALARLA
jgi:signal transduction histidine kinase/CheY-like chemotaxis protein